MRFLVVPAPLLLSWFRNGEPLEPPLAVNSNQTLGSLDVGSLSETYIDSATSHLSYTSGLLLASDENLSNTQQSSSANVQIKQRQLSNGIVESEITILSLTKDYLLNRIECRVSLLNEGQIIRKDYQIVSVNLDLHLSPLISKIRSKSPQTDFKAGTLAEFTCEVIGSRPPPKINWHIVTQTNQIIDLVSKKHLSNSNSNQQQPSTVQIVEDEHAEEFAIFHHSPPSTNSHQSNQQRSYKSTANQHTGSTIAIISDTNSDSLSATSATTLVSKQPFIFTIDYPQLSQDGNTSSSILKLRLSQRMQKLICRAANYEVQRDSEIEDQLTLNILYAPIVRIELGSNIQENSIKEGSDVYFECKINANPYVNEIQWFFNGNILASNYNGILIANHSLVLQSVKRETKGYYSCAAINSLGKSHSQNFFLRILFTERDFTP